MAERAPDSFERFYQREYRSVLALAHVLTGDPGRAEEVAQEAFMAAYTAWPRLVTPPAWVRTTVSNKAKSWWRRQHAEQRAIRRLDPPEVSEMPVDTAGFWEQVRGLPGRQALAIALFYLDDLPVSEIAEVMGCAESTARVRLTRGRRALAKRLGVDHE